MLVAAPIPASVAASVLGRTSPVVKLAVAVAWLLGLATTTDPGPPAALVLVAVLAALVLGSVAPTRLVAGLGPLLVAAVGIALTNLLFSGSNADPAAAEVLRAGPLRLTEPAIAAAIAMAVRITAIVSVGAAFALTTDPTRLVDALVQQAHLPSRFAYGALAAYQAVPRLGEDLATIRAARTLRGLPSSWHPTILVTLLVRAIRHADQLADAMDARAFGSGPRTTFRPLSWSPLDLVVLVAGVAVLLAALRLGTV